MKLIEWLKLPQTRSIENLDDPVTTLLHAEVIRNKPFLRRLYTDFYYQSFQTWLAVIENELDSVQKNQMAREKS
jgi:hypothetical protein